jgi:alpha-glucosidase
MNCFHWESYEHGGNIVKMSKASKDGECFILGDKATQMNLKGKRLENFATDQYAFQKDQEPLYKVVPLYWVTKQTSLWYFLQYI